MVSAIRSLTNASVGGSVERLVGGIVLLLSCGLLESIAVYYSHAWPTSALGILLWFGSRVIYVAVTLLLILALAQAKQPSASRRWGAWIVIGLSAFVSFLIARFAIAGFANSGDEFGYNYLADTLLHGRVWNPTIPAPLRDVFDTYYIGDHDGKRASQYPPGWPALLALFKLIHLDPYANIVLGLLASVFLWFALRRTQVHPNIQLGALILGVTAPFVLFNNASFYNHSLTATCLAAITWLNLRQRSLWDDVLIGVAFSLLLATRYETFLICGVLFGLDSVIRKRLGVVKPALASAIGALPITALLLWYNWRITGHPFETTLAWASPDITFGLHSNGMDGPHSLLRGFRHTFMWLTSWQDFASVLILPLYALALWNRIVTRALRWFDLLLPVTVAFFLLYPDYGGFQYGPRYWYIGYVDLPLTIAAGLPGAGGLWRVRHWRFDPVRMALLQLPSFIGFTAAFAWFVHLQTEVRAVPFQIAMTAPTPALVLMPQTSLPDVSWQLPDRMTVFQSRDFTRNGPDGLAAPVLLGRLPDLPQDLAAVCKAFPDRHVFQVIVRSPPPSGQLEPLCNN